MCWLPPKYDNGLTQFEVHKKWGFADIITGKIVVPAIYDYADPFREDYSIVNMGGVYEDSKSRVFPIRIIGGKYGVINISGEVMIPLQYEAIVSFHSIHGQYFLAKNADKWGLLDTNNNCVISFDWDYLGQGIYYDSQILICVIGTVPRKYGVFGPDFQPVFGAELDERPQRFPAVKSDNCYRQKMTYYIVKSGRKFGVLCDDGRRITDITLRKREAVRIIKTLTGTA